jgi:GcrA cell cycle regulator
MSDWTPARVAMLTGMWNEGKSGKEIADRLGYVTRNAVIGKAHRLGLKGVARPEPKPKQEKRPRGRPKIVRLDTTQKRNRAALNGIKGQILIAQRLGAKPVTRLLPKLGKVAECRWPEGDPKEPGFHFCEAKTEPGRPYCLEHCMRAYFKPHEEQPRQDEHVPIMRAAE